MTPPSLDRIQEIFCAALELPSAERPAYVQAECGADETLRQEVESLLAVEDSAQEFLEQPLVAQWDTVPWDTLPEFLAPAAYLEASDLAGEWIGPYQLTEIIGRGGMGTVWLARRDDEHYERQVAIKLLRHHGDDRLIRRFYQERQVLASLEHPDIARLYDGGVTSEGLPYLVMEYVEGSRISDHCDERNLGLRERVALVARVCDAVHYAHQKLIVHRDLKPSNVLVTADGDPKLLDFGIAKVLDETGQAIGDVTLTAERLLTPRYASPEQITGDAITVASDVYSLGVILYELLAACSPYDLEPASRRELEEQVVRGVDRPPSRAHAETESATGRRWSRTLAGDLDTIALKALRPEPHRRYRSPADLADDLRRYLTDRPVLARPDTVRYRSLKFVQRHWALVLSATAILSALVIALVVSLLSNDRLTSERKLTDDALTVLERALTSVDPATARTLDTTLMRRVLEDARQQVDDGLGRGTPVEARIRSTIGRTYSALGLFPAAAEQLERAVELQRELLGLHHRTTLESTQALGASLLEAAEYERAQPWIEIAANRTRETFGPEDALSLSARNNLAELYFELSDLDRAEAIFRDVLAIRGRLSPHAPETAISWGNLANLLMVRSRYDEARPCFERALAIMPEDRLERWSLVNNLGYLEASVDRLDEAERLYQSVYEARQTLLGPGHPETLATLNNIGTLYYRKGKRDDAERITRELLELRREHLGEDHDDTLRSWSNLSVFLRSRGKHTEAVAIQRRILERREAKFGPGHPQVLTVLGNLASSLFAAGEFADAKSTAETLVTRSRHKFGDEHEQTIDALYRLGFVERESGDPQAALARFERIVELADQVLPQTSSDRGYYRVEWGDTLRACDQYARAEEELRRGYEGLRSTLGIEHAYTRNAVRILGELYAEWDQPDRAAEFRELHQRNTGEAQKKNEPSKGDSS